MHPDNLIRQNSIIVNEGSGVLVNGITDKFSYIFTVRHVIPDINSISITNMNGQPIHVIECILHPDINSECAIIKVDFQKVDTGAYSNIMNVDQPAVMKFAGYPKLRRNAALLQNKHNILDGLLSNAGEAEFVVTDNNVTPYANIIGMSGGGVYHIINHQAVLVGVECQMDGQHEDEFPGKIKCISLTVYADLLDSLELPPLGPFYLKCFSEMLNHIFNFIVHKPENIAALKEKLIEFPKTWIDSGNLPSPETLMMKYSSDLILEGESLDVLRKQELWISFLEFLIIFSIIDDENIVDMDYISNMDRKRRIIYSAQEGHWFKHIKQILKFAKENLDENAVIVIASPQATPLLQPDTETLDNIIDDISIVSSLQSDLRIDSVLNHYSSFKIRHLTALHHEGVIKQENEYGRKAKTSEKLKHFREQYLELFN